MKEIIRMIKETDLRLEALYATQYVLKKKGEKSEEIESEIARLEEEKVWLEEVVNHASLIKM